MANYIWANEVLTLQTIIAGDKDSAGRLQKSIKHGIDGTTEQSVARMYTRLSEALKRAKGGG